MLTACQSQTNQPSDETVSAAESAPADCRTIQHVMGATEICGQPQRIVVLGPYVLESLLALNVQPVGYAAHLAFHQEDYTDPSRQIPYLGERITQPLANVGLAHTPSLEAILKLQPDLILGVESNNADQYENLSKIAPTVLVKRFEPELSLQITAQAVDRVEQAEQVLLNHDQRLTSAREQLASQVANQPQALLLLASQMQEMSLGSRYESCRLPLEAMGFQFVVPPGISQDDPNISAPIFLETLPQLNDADLVILLGYDFNDIGQFDSVEHFEVQQLSNLKQAWKENEIAQSLYASQAGRVYFIPAYLCAGLLGPIGTELYLEELKEQLLAPK